MKRLLVLFTLVSAILLLGLAVPFTYASNRAIALTPDPSGVLRLTLIGAPTSLNQLNAPPNCVSCWRIIQLENAYGLPINQDGSNNSKAGLFDWISTNANATVWDFNIRAGAKWSDGTAITSSDINFTFGLQSGYIMNTLRDSLGLTEEIKSVEAVNTSDTRLTLYVTDSRFGFGLAAQYYFAPVPEHVWANQNYTGSNFGQDVVSGPFYHLAYNGGSELILKANPYYWNGPGLSEIDVTFVSNSSESAIFLQSGQTDLASLTPAQVSGIAGNSSLGVKLEPDRGVVYLEYNASRSPFNNTSFRQALAYAVNTSAISQSVFAGLATPGVQARGLIPPSVTNWFNQSSALYPFNVTEAKNMLSSQGYSWNAAYQLLYPNGTIVSFKIYTDTNSPTDQATAQLVSANLKSIGVQISLVSVTLSKLVQNFTFNLGDIRSQLVVSSSSSLPFGDGYLDILPAYDLYYPWFIQQNSWLSPPSAQSEYEHLVSVANSSTNPAQFQSAVKDVDGLNAQSLPLLVLAYPDSIWGFRMGAINGLANSSFDMGGYGLDPAVFSTLACSSGCVTTSLTEPPITTTSSVFTSLQTSSVVSSSTSNSTTSIAQQSAPSTDLYEIVTIVVVLVAIVVGTIISRRKAPKPPGPPSKAEG